ncbi:phosphate-starvation-inducible protein PsiE [Pseudazoarcus pumilus]|uniref:Protein PsiE n=1 Tax=Pseudazoarcus pumilus TaxID=2067960 RepID=A0A2I6S9T2_9RHOO|nr:phosphate-starvation-inducible PsiE family protein [Pseudazoarcus pumilus]AUN96005.1 phosphate-starvation-inducible E [Pseudazoarcus pumilus]
MQTDNSKTTSASEKVPSEPPVEVSDTEEVVVERGLKYLQRALLLVVAIMTVVATGMEILAVFEAGAVNLGDILLMFLYAEVISMVAVFYSGRGLTMVFPILIAITALARLIVLQGKEMDPSNILIEAGAIFLLALAAVVLLRFARK